jgi:hypothetical protein
MKINELFEEIQEKLIPEDLNGEFILQGNCIIWSYNLDNDSEEIEAPVEDDDELNFSFDAVSPQELLQDAYIADSEKLETLLDELEETDNWTFSEPETIDNVISFKLF